MNHNTSKTFIGEMYFNELMFKAIEKLCIVRENKSEIHSGEYMIKSLAMGFYFTPEKMTKPVLDHLRAGMLSGMVESMQDDPQYKALALGEQVKIAKIIADNVLARGEVIGERMGSIQKQQSL
jgi:hypothetical protein